MPFEQPGPVTDSCPWPSTTNELTSRPFPKGHLSSFLATPRLERYITPHLGFINRKHDDIFQNKHFQSCLLINTKHHISIYMITLYIITNQLHYSLMRKHAHTNHTDVIFICSWYSILITVR